MAENAIKNKCYVLLKKYFRDNNEKHLTELAELGSKLATLDTPIHEISKIHEEAVHILCKEFPEIMLKDAAEMIATPMMKLTLAFENTTRKRFDNREKAEKELQSKYDLLNAIIEGTEDLVFAKDISGSNTLSNSSYLKAIGHFSDEIIGKINSDLFSPDNAQKYEEEDKKVLTSRVSQIFENTILVRGEERIFSTTKAPYFYGSGEVRGIVCIARDITEHKKAKGQYHRLSNLVENSLNEIYIFDAKTYQFVYVNPAARNNLGYSLEEMMTLTPLDLKEDYTLKKFEQLVKPLRDGKKIKIEFFTNHKRKDGSRYDVEVHLQKSVESGLEIFTAIILDITKRREAEKAIRNSQLLYESLVEHLPQYIIRKDLEGRFVYANDRFCKLVNRTIDKVIGKTDFDISPRELAEKFWASDRQVVETGKTYESVQENTRADGEKLFERIIKTPVYDSAGQIVGVQRIFWDVTESKLAEQVLFQSEERYRSLYQHTPIMLHTIDEEGRLTSVNDFWTKKIGYTREEVLGLDSYRFLTEESRRRIEKSEPDFIKLGIARDRPYQVRKKNGKIMDILLSATTEKDAKGKAIRSLVAIVDITKLKRAKEKVKIFLQVIEQSPVEVIITDTRGIIEYVNPKFTQVTGYTAEEAIGNTQSILKSGTTPQETYKTLWETVKAGGEWRGEIQNKKKCGELYWESMFISAIKNTAGDTTHYLAIKEDITKQKQAEMERVQFEEKFRQSQKMETIGRLAGGIAHDFNNILQAIHGYVDLCLEDLESNTQVYKDLQEVMIATDRAKEIVQQILAFSRTELPELKPVSMHAVVSEALKLLKITLSPNIEIHKHIKESESLVVANSAQMHQIVMNLCVNALDAMKDRGGVLTISLETVAICDAFKKDIPTLSDEKYVQLTISDTGTGINKKVLDRIFEPFFTTKEVGKGTGLGLSVVHGIVQAHHGNISAESEPGQGTTFRVWLPVTTRKAPEAKKIIKPIANGYEKILLVDDDEIVISLMKRVLERNNFKVTTSKNGAEALEVFRTQPDHFDIVITDQMMPKMNGLTLAAEALNIRADIPIILISGYTGVVIPERIKAIGIKDFITKPVTSSHLMEVISRVMERGQGNNN